MPVLALDDRCVVLVAGPDAEHFLQNIVTTDIDALKDGEAKAGALLTPQGKILFDFLISRAGPDRFRLDVRKGVAADFIRRLMLYRLRAKAEIAVEDGIEVVAVWGAEGTGSRIESTGSETDSTTSRAESTWLSDVRFPADQRVSRLYRPESTPTPYPSPQGGGEAASVSESPSPQGRQTRGGVRGGGTEANQVSDPKSNWTRLRIANGVAESGSDYDLGDAFPHDILLDQIDGVGFRKGCYIGQEVVSRMQHRGTARRRVLVATATAPLPASRTDLIAGGKPIGILGSVEGPMALAIARIDKVKAAVDAGEPITAGGVPVTLAIPPGMRFVFPESASAEDI